ncbi:hypothetical protein [Luteimonas kalidii]|uniref:DUF2784 domain-containing protein n=1 Tax=Luteimonas kalidii TaxID=3042025 RepID=A0ABT6JNP9_9GAMM|nr:hypothetical protein [Luteimonas kalidii]MDH5832315.1 hypothetical protein [Luteimonas kalidii]
MDTFDALAEWLLLASAAAVPWLVARFIRTSPRWKRVLAVHLVSLALGLAILSAYAYWPHIFVDLRLGLLGYDQGGMSQSERSAGVEPEHREIAAHLFNSTMGVGWPLRVAVLLAVYVPYSLAAGFLGMLLFKSGRRPGYAA